MSRQPSPNAVERTLIARCLLNEGILIGSPSEIWSHPYSTRTLITWRECMEAIGVLTATKHAVHPSHIKSIVMRQRSADDIPLHLDEVADFLVKDNEARRYWDTAVTDERFPHRCPLCKTGAAFVGLNLVECKAKCSPSSSRF